MESYQKPVEFNHSHHFTKAAQDYPKLMAKRALLKVLITMQQEARSDELFAVDVGPALQFLEFCTAFGEILQLKKGEPESILKEATSGCTLRRRQYSPPVRFHTQLLAMIQKDMDEDCPSSPISNGSSWFQELGKHISSSRYSSKEFTPELFTRGNSGYEDLDSSKKLHLLNFLCDEALCTKDSRAWIEEQNEKLVQKGKEAKEKVLAVKEKEKQLKQQMQDEVAKAILEKNGGPLSISEHEDLVSKIKTDAAKAHAERLEALGMTLSTPYLGNGSTNMRQQQQSVGYWRWKRY